MRPAGFSIQKAEAGKEFLILMDAFDFVPRLAKQGKDRKKEAKIAGQRRAMAKALLAVGRPYREVAEALDISVGSVHNIMKESSEDIMRILSETRARHAMKCLLLSDHILGRISDYDIIHASLREKVSVSAILADKALKFEIMTAQAGFPADTGKPGETDGGVNGGIDLALEQPDPKNHLKTGD